MICRSCYRINSHHNNKGKVGDGPEAIQQVHGLTTAAGVWLSAAVGVGAGGRLYFVSAYSVWLKCSS